MGKEITIWKGTSRDVAEALGMTMPTVSKGIRLLTYASCIQLIKHGGGPTGSIYQLIREPQENEYQQLQERSDSGLTTIPTVEQRLQDSINKVYKLIAKLELRIERLERVNKANEIHDIN